MPAAPLAMIDHVDHVEILIWVALRVWLPGSSVRGTPVLLTATLSWIVAWLCIQAVPIVLHELGSWPMH